jgi:hypothetical protein
VGVREEVLSESLDEVMLFTYVDKDGWVPPNRHRPDAALITRTAAGVEPSPLALAVDTLPTRCDDDGDAS